MTRLLLVQLRRHSHKIHGHPPASTTCIFLTLPPPAIGELFVFLSHSPAIKASTSFAHLPSSLPISLACIRPLKDRLGDQGGGVNESR
jgi:hypothetical protein